MEKACRKGWTFGSICLSLLVTPWLAMAASPVFLLHEYQGADPGTNGVTLRYQLRLENAGQQPLYGVVLVSDALAGVPSRPTSVAAGDLLPGLPVLHSVVLHRKQMPSERELRELPLRWAVEGSEAAGTARRWVDVLSHPVDGGMP